MAECVAGGLGNLLRLEEVRNGRVEFAEIARQQAAVEQRPRRDKAVAERPGQRQTLVKQRNASGLIAHGFTQEAKRQRHAIEIAPGAGQLHALVEQPSCLLRLTLQRQDVASSEESAGARRRRCSELAPAQRQLQPSPPFAGPPARQPEQIERTCDLKPSLGAPIVAQTPRQRGGDIRVIALNAIEPHQLAGPPQLTGGGLGNGADVGRVSFAQCMGLAAPPQLFQRVFAHRLQQAETRLVRGSHEQLHHAMRHKGFEGRQNIAPSHRFNSGNRETPDEHPKPSEQRLFRLTQKLIAPVEGRTERQLAGGEVARPSGEQRQRPARLQPDEQRGRREQPHADGGQLDRQGQAIKPLAELRDSGTLLAR